MPPQPPPALEFPPLMIRALFVLSLSYCVYANEIRVDKAAADATGNPTISIKSSGNADVDRAVSDAILYADWFTPGAGGSTYALAVEYSATGQHDLVFRLSGGGKQLFAFRKNAATEVALKHVVHAAVDELITRTFPDAKAGPCHAKLAYVKERAGVKEIWLADFDGAGPRQLTYNQHLSVEPEWGPQGQFLTYTSYSLIANQVRLVDTSTMQQRTLSSERGLNSNASLSNSGKYAALCLSLNGEVDIYARGVVQDGKKRLTQNSKIVDTSPCWSPDDRLICFVSDRSGMRPTLYVMSANGGPAEKIMVDTNEAVSPDWCPLTNRICFAQRRGRSYRIGFVDMNLPRKQRVVEYAHDDVGGDWEEPTWAADGRHIVCARTVGGRTALFMLDTKFRTVRALKNFEGNDSLPALSP